MTGTLVNTAAIITGSLLGMIIHSRLPQKMVNIVFQGLGLFAVSLGISMALRSDNYILSVISIVSGGVLGQWIAIDRHLQRLSSYLERKSRQIKKKGAKHFSLFNTPDDIRTTNNFAEGFITASMLFCVGSMSILGAIEEGTGQIPTLFLTKSIMDGVSCIALAASFGVGVIFSCLPVFFYQAGLTLFAAYISRYMSEEMIAGLSSVGGIMLIGIGLNILKIKNLNIINMLPALIIVVVLTYFWP